MILHGTRLVRVTFGGYILECSPRASCKHFSRPARFISGKVFRLVRYQRRLVPVCTQVHVRTCTRENCTHRKSIVRLADMHPRKKRRERGENAGNMGGKKSGKEAKIGKLDGVAGSVIKRLNVSWITLNRGSLSTRGNCEIFRDRYFVPNRYV